MSETYKLKLFDNHEFNLFEKHEVDYVTKMFGKENVSLEIIYSTPTRTVANIMVSFACVDDVWKIVNKDIAVYTNDVPIVTNNTDSHKIGLYERVGINLHDESEVTIMIYNVTYDNPMPMDTWLMAWFHENLKFNDKTWEMSSVLGSKPFNMRRKK